MAFFVVAGPPVTITVNMHIKSMGSVSEGDQVRKKFQIFMLRRFWNQVETRKTIQ
jgi:hypothetical protein